MNNEFKKIKSTQETRYVLETATSGATSTGAIATNAGSVGKVQKRNPDNILAQEGDKVKVPTTKPRNFVAKNAKIGGAGQHKDKKKAQKQGNEKHKKPFAEGFNGEYDDEAGMAHSNLLTTARAVMGLLKTIKDRDNLPEWGQEKIAKAEMMLVSVWDYLQSQKELGNDPQVEAYGRRDAYQRDYDSSVSGMGKRDSLAYRMDGGANDEGEDDFQNNYGVWINGRLWKVFATQYSANAVARSLQAKGKDAKVGLTAAPVSEQDDYMESLAQNLYSAINEKAVSKAQQRFMGMVHAAKKGEKAASPEVAKAAKGIGKKDAKDFAATKHKGLPEKKKSKN